MRAGGKHNDLDDVGTTERHASFFEMLGNFSFGQYFKDGAIELAWEFVTERMGFDPDLLWATVFAGDPELGLGLDEVAIAAWERIGMPRERIVALPRSENFWQAAETGPCGPEQRAVPRPRRRARLRPRRVRDRAASASASSSSGTSCSWSSTSATTGR